jgi:hypothetical protein
MFLSLEGNAFSSSWSEPIPPGLPLQDTVKAPSTFAVVRRIPTAGISSKSAFDEDEVLSTIVSIC